MSNIGYYRYKTTADVAKSVNFVINGVLAGVKGIIPLDSCDDDIALKYLDKNGQYRFYSFNSYYKTYDTPQKIGSANKFLTNIASDQTNSKNIGFRNARKIEISADVPIDQLAKLVDMYSSPRIYYYIGVNNSDTPSDWLEVEAKIRDGIVRPRKKNTTRVDMTISLPENYSVTML